MLGLPRINFIVYVDDIALLATNIDDINFVYIRLNCLIKQLKIKSNKQKSKCVVLRMSKNKCNLIKKKVVLDVVEDYNCIGQLLEHNFDGKNIY